jgi:hypothetical protein
VKRVFWVIPVNDKERLKVAAKTGFQLIKSIREVTIEGDLPANVYQCTRP